MIDLIGQVSDEFWQFKHFSLHRRPQVAIRKTHTAVYTAYRPDTCGPIEDQHA
jgi:hypothetical protein